MLVPLNMHLNLQVSPQLYTFYVGSVCIDALIKLELPPVLVTPGPRGTSPRDAPASAHVPPLLSSLRLMPWAGSV